jgi:arabinogalactan oligomer/maltooligosaccharide transport system permease protein
VILLVAAALARELTVWHAYRGAERDTLEALLRDWSAAHPDSPAAPLFVPYETLPGKVTAAVPRGNGPDLFLYAHENIADWEASGIVLPVDPGEGFVPSTLAAVTRDGHAWGWPFTYKCLALFYDRATVATPPATTDDLVALARSLTRPDHWGFAYEVTSAYQNAAWLHGYGGGVLDGDTVRLDRPENVAALRFIADLATLVPAEPSGALVTQLFDEGRVSMVLGGPWLLGDLTHVDAGVAPLPVVSATGLPARPWLTVEAVFLARESADARALGAWLASAESGRRRSAEARQLVPRLDVPTDPALAGFQAQLANSVPMPTDPAFALTWEPLARSLRRLARGVTTPEQAASEAQTTFDVVSRPLPPPADPRPWLAGGVVLAGAGLWRARRWRPTFHFAHLWVAPAAVGVTILTLLPFVVGAAVSLFERDGVTWRFVGLSHFLDILFARDFPIESPLSFWYTLGVTVLWTLVNVVLHVGIGVALALLLREPWVRVRGVFRALLILPWAIPSYITALAWKGMFHRQFGAINALLTWLGAEPVSWFAQFSTAFAANVATNTWLGFPFMMVVTLGALASIPRDLEEAAEVDGATPWQRFRLVTLPLLLPALLPAVVLGSIWTFNMFNIIYLVSAGEPDGSTDILVSQAYKWAFTRGHRYGYAAAYAVLIFGVLVLQGRLANRLAGRRVL